MSEIHITMFGNVFSSNEIEKSSYSKERLNRFLENKEFTGEKYNLAVYQRNYSWDSDLCMMFVNDLITKSDEGYNFGVITRSKNLENYFELIDGQQRLTTVFLTVLVIYRMVKKYNASGSDLIKIESFLNSWVDLDRKTIRNEEFIFQSDTSSSLLKLKKITADVVKNCDIDFDKSDTIVTNFFEIEKMLEQKLKIEISTAKKIIVLKEIFEKIIFSKVILLEYESSNEALQSFISLNMKSKQLEDFEVSTAYLLEGLSVSEQNLIKDRVVNIEGKFEEIKTQIGISKISEYFKNYCIAKDYEELVGNPKEVLNFKFGLSNNYVKHELQLNQQKIDFTSELLDFTSNLEGFLKLGKIDIEILRKIHGDDIIDESIDFFNKRNAELEFLCKGISIKKRKSLELKLFKKIKAHILRYMLSKLYLIFNSRKIDVVKENINELVRVLILHHFSSVFKYNYDESRKSISEKLYKDIKELKLLIDKSALDYISISSSKNRSSKRKIVSDEKVRSLIILFQVRFDALKSKKIGYNTPIIDLPISTEYNLEHFIIDQSRYKVKLGRDDLILNCIYLDKNTNEEWGSGKIKNFMSKSLEIDKKRSSMLKLNCFINEEYKKIFNSDKYNEIKELLSDNSSKIDEANSTEYLPLLTEAFGELGGSLDSKLMEYFDCFGQMK